MGRVAAGALVALDPFDARTLWLDTARWPTFVEGFSHVVRARHDWPAPGGVLEWQSGPHGRGRVREQVRELRAGEVVVAVHEERLAGTQSATFRLTPAGTEVTVTLEYRLTRGGPLLDVLYVRRALRDALRRTVARYAREAAADAELGAG